MTAILKVFAFILGIGACGLSFELLRRLSERNGDDHLRAMAVALALVVAGTLLHVVVLSVLGLLRESGEAMPQDGSKSEGQLPAK